jgi:photosystem II stability/assembly factor-like uncharacterized protein
MLFILACIFAINCDAQWVLQNSGTENMLKSVFFTNDQTGYITGDQGIILKTTDGGAHWISLDAGTSSSLNSVFFINPDTGYIAGNNGVILMTSDGGTTWESQNSGTTSNLNSIRFADANTGYIAGMGAKICKTTDKGENWTLSDAPAMGRLWTTDTNTVYLVGGNINIFRTNDGAASWDLLLWNSTYGTLNDVCFSGKANGIAVGGSWAQGHSYSLVYSTKDSGTDWGTWLQINSGWLNGTCFADTTVAYAVGADGIIFRSANAGDHWSKQASGTKNDLFSVHFPSPETGYIVGDSGTILKTVNGGVGLFEPSSAENILLLSPNPSKGILTVTLPITSINGILKIMDIQGREVMRENVISRKQEIDINQLKNGFYCLKVETGGKTIVARVIKN